MLRIGILLLCAAALAAPSAIPIKGSAWRLALADLNGDGTKEIVYGAWEGAVRASYYLLTGSQGSE